MKRLIGLVGMLILSTSIASCGVNIGVNILNQYDAYANAKEYHVLWKDGEVFNDAVSNIDLDWVSGKVTILSSDEYSGVMVIETVNNIYQDDFLCHVWHNNGTLLIKYCASSVSTLNAINKDITIYVPTDKDLDSITINNNSSNVEVRRVTSKKITVDNISGNVSLKSCRSEEIGFNGGSGSLSLGLTYRTNLVNIKQNSGSSTIFIPEKISGFTTRFNTESGEFYSEFDGATVNNTYFYKDSTNLILEVGDFTSVENAEIEDLIPISIMEKGIDRLFRSIEDKEFIEEYNEKESLLPQIERFAEENGFELQKGWKVELAKSVKSRLLKVSESETLTQGKKLFDKFDKLDAKKTKKK